MAWRSRMSPSGQIANFGEGKVTPYGRMHIVNTKLKRANVSFSTLALYHWIRTQWRNKRKRKKKTNTWRRTTQKRLARARLRFVRVESSATLWKDLPQAL